MKIEEIDKNFLIDNEELKDFELKDVFNKPFSLHGVMKGKDGKLIRMPEKIAKTVSKNVEELNYCTAGGRVRFQTYSNYIAIYAIVESQATPSMSIFGSNAITTLVEINGKQILHGAPCVPVDNKISQTRCIGEDDKRLKSVTVVLPNYAGVSNLFIGVKKGYEIYPEKPYKKGTVLYYGSSITQGASASRTGLDYENRISNEINCDFINLGFSGSCKAEKQMAEYLKTIPCDLFVCDYDFNAPNLEHLKNTYENLLDTFIEGHKNIPIIMVTRPIYDALYYKEDARKDYIYSVYKRLKKQGNKVYFIGGNTFFDDKIKYDCVIDGTHPNDLGFYFMAKKIGKIIKKLLKDKKEK